MTNHNSTKQPREITLDQLRSVSGGMAVTTDGMAPPKYSAGWWDFVRSRGLAK